jgi:hypothetical protein
MAVTVYGTPYQNYQIGSTRYAADGNGAMSVDEKDVGALVIAGCTRVIGPTGAAGATGSTGPTGPA